MSTETSAAVIRAMRERDEARAREAAPQRHPAAIAQEEWFQGAEGARCSDGAAAGIYLHNRLAAAFQAGWHANEQLARTRRGCTSKIRHATEAKALAAAARAAAKRHVKGLHVYRCPNCNGWHLTSRGR